MVEKLVGLTAIGGSWPLTIRLEKQKGISQKGS